MKFYPYNKKHPQVRIALAASTISSNSNLSMSDFGEDRTCYKYDPAFIQSIFSMMNKYNLPTQFARRLWPLLCRLCLGQMALGQQTGVITGKVTGENGIRAGATVFIPGTGDGTQSNADGSYRFTAPEGT